MLLDVCKTLYVRINLPFVESFFFSCSEFIYLFFLLGSSDLQLFYIYEASIHPYVGGNMYEYV